MRHTVLALGLALAGCGGVGDHYPWRAEVDGEWTIAYPVPDGCDDTGMFSFDVVPTGHAADYRWFRIYTDDERCPGGMDGFDPLEPFGHGSLSSDVEVVFQCMEGDRLTSVKLVDAGTAGITSAGTCRFDEAATVVSHER